MRERSAFSGCMLAILVIVAVAGLYVMVDNFDLLRRSQEETQQALTENTRTITRLRNTITSGGIAIGQSSPAAHQKLPFHNSDLRDPDAEDGGKLVRAVASFSGNMNDIINNEAVVALLWQYCNDTLGERNYCDAKKFEPRMAGWWEVSPDGKEITVKLREDIYWHDFTDPVTKKKWENIPVTAHDFAFYLDTIRNPDLPCDPIRSYYKDLDRIEVIDNYNLKFIWKETYFLSLIVSLETYPLPRHFYRPDPNTTDEEFAEDMLKNKVARNQMIVGCGPYIFEKYIKGDRIVLRRNPDYFGPLPSIETLVFREIADREKAFIEFKRDQLDGLIISPVQWHEQTPEPEYLTVCNDAENALAITREYAARKKAVVKAGRSFGEHKYEKFLYNRYVYYYIGWNMRRPVFADREVRVALTHCVNREKIIKDVYLGLAQITTGNFLPISIYYDHTIKPWPFDIEKAKEMLKDAGWEDTDNDGVIDKDLDGDGRRDPFEFTFLMVSADPYQSQWVPMVQEDMKKAGIRMKVKSAEWAVYTEQLDEFNFDACSLGWGGAVESDPYQLWHSSQADKKGSSNYCGFKNAEADEIIETARRTLDMEKRIKLYQRLHRILHEEQPYTFLLFPNMSAVVHKRYNNVIAYPYYHRGMSSNLQWIPKREQR